MSVNVSCKIQNLLDGWNNHPNTFNKEVEGKQKFSSQHVHRIRGYYKNKLGKVEGMSDFMKDVLSWFEIELACEGRCIVNNWSQTVSPQAVIFNKSAAFSLWWCVSIVMISIFTFCLGLQVTMENWFIQSYFGLISWTCLDFWYFSLGAQLPYWGFISNWCHPHQPPLNPTPIPFSSHHQYHLHQHRPTRWPYFILIGANSWACSLH